MHPEQAVYQQMKVSDKKFTVGMPGSRVTVEALIERHVNTAKKRPPIRPFDAWRLLHEEERFAVDFPFPRTVGGWMRKLLQLIGSDHEIKLICVIQVGKVVKECGVELRPLVRFYLVPIATR